MSFMDADDENYVRVTRNAPLAVDPADYKCTLLPA